MATWHATAEGRWEISSGWGAGCDILNVDECTGGTCWDMMMPWPFVVTIP